MNRLWLAVFGLYLGAAQAGGAGPPPNQLETSRTIPVLILNYSFKDSDSDGPFICSDGQGVFVEFTPNHLRLTRRGDVFVLPKLAQEGGYGENGVSWVSKVPRTAELTLGRTQPIQCQLPASAETFNAQINLRSAQQYGCADEMELLVAVLENAGQPLAAVSQSQRGQAVATTDFLPQVRSASGVKYQNSEWTWFSQGQEGFLEFRGKKVAQNCRSQ